MRPRDVIGEPAGRIDERSRLEMVALQIEARGIRDPLVLRALRAVPRRRFVPPDQAPRAYEDRPLPIGLGQTISQPYIVALMTELVAPRAGARVLEIGTGSGYQAAVLAECGCEVDSLEILEPLARAAGKTLRGLGYDRVRVHVADGSDGWPAGAPYDGILVAAAPSSIPQPLIEQLAPGGRLVLPVGAPTQELTLVTRWAGGFARRAVAPVRFVPLTGRAQQL